MRLLIGVYVLWCAVAASANGTRVQIVTSADLPKPAMHGIDKLREAIVDQGIEVVVANHVDETDDGHVIVAGLAGDSVMAAWMRKANLELPSAAQSLAIGHVRGARRPTIVLCGADAIGLMYAALDTAQRIGWASDDEPLFAPIETVSESPCLVDRSVSTYTMQRRWFEQRLHDPEYWQQYFDMLAASRINSFVIIFGYECGGFMAPMYPFFFDVDGFPGVQLTDISAEQQADNTAALQHLIDSAHERGIRVTLGIWDHIYRGGVQGGGIEGASELVGKQVPHLVHGVTSENLADYTKAALKKLVAVFPGIDAVQFRMHWESGLTREETPGFWKEVFATLHQLNPDIRFDLRAKGLPDEVIEDAIEQELPFRVTTKYWMEQLGLPFHPTHINPQNQRDRRHGYADLLRYPKQYDVHWRVWNGGTTRFLLWADPEYVKRFVESAQIYDGDSFEVNEMLATKMLGQPHDAKPFHLHTPANRHYEYEFQRYWHYYQVWGRITYNPSTDPAIWRNEFDRRFGDQAGPLVMRALHRASQILPRIVAASYDYRYFPTTRGWAEMMRLGDLPEYAKGTGTDVEQFQSYQDAARQLLAGQRTPLRTPQQTAAWFTSVGQQVLDDIEAATAAGGERKGTSQAEFRTTTTDLRILAQLALYHAARMRAAVWYNVYLLAESDEFAMNQCLVAESKAIAAWRGIIAAADDVYPETLHFGVHRVGFSDHWKEELQMLEEGYAELQAMPRKAVLDAGTRQRLLQQIQSPPERNTSIQIERVATATPGQDLLITATVEEDSPLESLSLRYRHLTQFEDYQSVPMVWDAERNGYAATIPADFIVPQWDLMYFIEAVDGRGQGCKLPIWKRNCRM